MNHAKKFAWVVVLVGSLAVGIALALFLGMLLLSAPELDQRSRAVPMEREIASSHRDLSALPSILGGGTLRV
jgi:hypothetical protein